jgi:hypothetical protein
MKKKENANQLENEIKNLREALNETEEKFFQTKRRKNEIKNLREALNETEEKFFQTKRRKNIYRWLLFLLCFCIAEYFLIAPYFMNNVDEDAWCQKTIITDYPEYSEGLVTFEVGIFEGKEGPLCRIDLPAQSTSGGNIKGGLQDLNDFKHQTNSTTINLKVVNADALKYLESDDSWGILAFFGFIIGIITFIIAAGEQPPMRY